ncbi:MAG: hypothetical protein ABI651_13790 [Verrucomicrobiota bacterium]
MKRLGVLVCGFFFLLGNLSYLSAWGQPTASETAYPYPGSVEHLGPAAADGAFFFNAKSLVSNFIVRDRSGELPAAPVTYAEPIINYVLKTRQTGRTGRERAPVKVYTMKPGGPPVHWSAGKLPIGTYMLRVIGALGSEEVAMPPRQVIFQLRINDGLDGSSSVYVLRGRGLDNFFCMQEFGFHVVDQREINLEVSLVQDSEAPIHLHNLEIHDILAGCAKEAGKTMPSLYTLAERSRARKAFGETGKGKKMLAEIASSPKSAGAARRRRDEEIWNSLPPLNCAVNENYTPLIGRETAFAVDTQGSRSSEKVWFLNRVYGGEYNFYDWQKPFEAVHDRWDEVGRHPVSLKDAYTLAEYLAHKPLGATGDRGWGVLSDRKEGKLPVIVFPVLRLNTTALNAAAHHLSPETIDRYYIGGDEAFARDMAIYLCRYAYWLPTYSLRHCIEFATWKAELPWMPTRFYMSKYVNHDYAIAYDKLFPFIKNNHELAEAVGRFVPWVKTPDDVVRLLDSHLVQYMAKNMICDRYYYDNESGEIMITLAAIQANARLSEPWMEFLWSRVYYYPIGHQPLPDVISINTQRDGSSTIGSSFYSMNGGPAVAVAKSLEAYLRTGGFAKYDLRDAQSYSKALAGCYFPVESPVAGRWTLSVGDVGGPAIKYGQHTEPSVNADVGWKWTHDPKFAWLLVHERGQRGETEEEWKSIVDAAVGVPDPLMHRRSRVLSDWSGILESGVGDPDFRFHRAAAIRVGRGHGHEHNDTLDLRVWAQGLIMSGDLGQRGSYGKPTHAASLCHNVLQIDSDDLNSHSWVRNLSDMAGVQYLQAEAARPNSSILRRQIALIDVSEGRASRELKPSQDAKVVPPNSYVFDVFRATGGKMHTYCFHGCVDDLNFAVNSTNRKFLPRDGTPERARLEETDPEAQYLRDFRWTRADYMGAIFRPEDADWVADAPDETLQATWRLSRVAEQRMTTGGGAMTEPRKFTRLHFFNPQGLRLLHGIVIDKDGQNKLNPEVPYYAGRCLFVQKRSPTGTTAPLTSAFAAVIEPYAGEPFIREHRILRVEPNENDALRAVAVEVETSTGRTDICFADGHSDRKCTLPDSGVEVTGEFAFVSRDAEGIVSASLTGGTRLKTQTWILSTDASNYRAKITKIDYLSRTLTLDRVLPADALRGAFVEVGDDLRRTTYELSDVQTAGATIAVRTRKSLEILRTSITKMSATTSGRGTVVKTRIGGLGQETGAWVVNAAFSKWWRLSKADPEAILDGPASPDDFKNENGHIIVLELGPGSELILPTRVSMVRVRLQDGYAFEVRANVSFTLQSGRSLKLSLDGRIWRELADGLVPANPDGAVLYLRGLN